MSKVSRKHDQTLIKLYSYLKLRLLNLKIQIF